jgi:putative membrane protein
MWINKFMNTDDQARVAKAVQEAEKRTTGEIVPMIVRRSTGVGHVGPIIFLILLLVMSVSDFLLVRYESLVNELLYYFFGESVSFDIFLVIFTVLFFFLTVWLSYYLARFEGLQRFLTSAADLEFQSHERAQLEFYWSKTNQTQDRTGILIFLSLMEHRCVVLADEAIAKKLPPETWQTVVDQVLAGVKKKRPADGLSQAIHTCGEILAKHFPGQSSGTNELSNLLIIKD